MKYILGIGLNYKKYKKDATIKIYLNDELIEIYQLTNNIESIKVPTNTIKKYKILLNILNVGGLSHMIHLMKNVECLHILN